MRVITKTNNLYTAIQKKAVNNAVSTQDSLLILRFLVQYLLSAYQNPFLQESRFTKSARDCAFKTDTSSRWHFTISTDTE